MFVTALMTAAVALAQADQAQPPEDAKLAQQVRRLVRQLDFDTQAEREMAEKDLLELGPAALAHLPPPADDMPAEMRVRLERVRLVLERKQSEEFTAGAKITLTGEMKLSKALQELERQSGNKMFDYRERFGEEAGDTDLTLKLAKVPFWQALDDVMDQAKLARYPFPEQPGIAVQNRPEGMLPAAKRASYAGAFRVEALEFEAIRDLRREDSGALQLRFEIAWEPRLKPIALFHDLEKLVITGADGKALNADLSDAVQEIPVTPGDIASTLTLPFPLPPRSVPRIASLKGKLEALVPGKSEEFKFANLSGKQPVSFKKGGVEVTVEQVRKNNKLWEAFVLVRFGEAAGALESHRDWVSYNPVWMVTKDGKKITDSGYNIYRRDEDSVGVAYLFEIDDPKNYSLLYATPTMMLRVPIEYELKDLPLP